MKGPWRRLRNRALWIWARWVFPVAPRPDLEKLGSDYGGWIVPTSMMGPASVCYCAGAGEDISFDLELIRRFECQLHAFDPTPRSVNFVQRTAAHVEQFRFHDVGLWSEDATLKFFAPADPKHVSHSVVNLQGTADYFEARCRRLSGIARELGHSRIDLLKMDIEGAEYEVLRSLLEDRLLPSVLCVEFDQPTPFRRVAEAVRMLTRERYQLVSIDNWNYTFVRHPAGVPLASPRVSRRSSPGSDRPPGAIGTTGTH